MPIDPLPEDIDYMIQKAPRRSRGTLGFAGIILSSILVTGAAYYWGSRVAPPSREPEVSALRGELSTLQGQQESIREELARLTRLVQENSERLRRLEARPGINDPAPASVDDRRVPSTRTYVVKPGDTLGKIAQKFYGDSSEYRRIVEANSKVLTRPDSLSVGMALKIP